MSGAARVLVVAGGGSSEREISLCSGQGAAAALVRLGYDVVSADFDEDFADRVRRERPDVVFNALHGTGGEDGTAQGVLEWLGVPYTGSDVRACAVSMDKHLTKKLAAAEGLPTAPWELLRVDASDAPPAKSPPPGELGLPLVIKPRAEGSSVGVRIVRTGEEWARAMRDVAGAGDMVIEQYVSGREFSCGVLFDRALPVVEIMPLKDGFYSYDAKYAEGGSRHETPARIDAELSSRIQTFALGMHRLIGLRDYSRTDVIAREDGRLFILEINALTGLTPTSIFPEECAAVGISYDELVDQLTTAALRRGKASPLRPVST
jgi:D-alanine-D-alanine ligase